MGWHLGGWRCLAVVDAAAAAAAGNEHAVAAADVAAVGKLLVEAYSD